MLKLTSVKSVQGIVAGLLTMMLLVEEKIGSKRSPAVGVWGGKGVSLVTYWVRSRFSRLFLDTLVLCY